MLARVVIPRRRRARTLPEKASDEPAMVYATESTEPPAPDEFGAPYGQSMPAPLVEWDVDRIEGEAVEQLKWSAQEAFPEPSIYVPEGLQSNIAVTSIDALLNWGRRSATWPLAFGLACCVFEMIASAMSRFDLARFGMEAMRATPRQADLLIVSGTLTWKMAPAVRRIYDQMAEPKWVIAMGVCATSGGPYYQGYSVVPGVNHIVPVDVYVPGCPPRPDALLYGIMQLHEKIKQYSVARDAAGVRRP